MKRITLLLITIGLYISSFATIDTLNVNITNDTILNADTVYVGQEIVIETGNTLTIAPGVVLIFKGDTAFNKMQNTVAGYFYVKGNINAAGLFDNRITFTKADSLNWGGILFHNSADSSLLKYCNISYGGGIDSVENVNYKGAVSVTNNKVKIYSCNFTDNGNAVYLNGANINLYNNIFANNNTAVMTLASDFFMGNNTISDNTNSLVCTSSSSPTIINSIIYGNTNMPVWDNATVTYSDVEDGATGTGNLNIDPEFTSMYKISACSGVINYGSTDANMILDNKDFFGNDRVFDVVVDMGAYENQFEHSYYVSTDTTTYSICGDSIEINGTWYSNDTTFQTTYSPAVNYCDSTVNIVVKEFTYPTITFSPADTIVCLNQQFPLFASISPEYPSATYSWTTNTDTVVVDTGSYVQAIMDSYTKQYYLTVNIDGCTLTDTASTNVFDEYVINLGPDSTDVCRGYVIDAGAGQKSYEWSTGETTNAITVLTTGLYEVTVIDTNSCRNIAQVYVPILPSPVVDFENDTVKIYTDGNTVLGGVSLGYDSYLWNTGATTPFITVNGSIGIGNHPYWLYCSFTNGCEASDTVIVKVLDGVNVNELNTTNGINVYPNPSNGVFNVSGEFSTNNNVTITVLDITGKTVLIKKLDNVSILNQEIDLSSNNKGIYFVKINNNDKTATYKVTVE